MKMIRGRSRAISSVNEEKSQVLLSRMIWDEDLGRIEVFRNNAEGCYGQIGEGYPVYLDFQKVF